MNEISNEPLMHNDIAVNFFLKFSSIYYYNLQKCFFPRIANILLYKSILSMEEMLLWNELVFFHDLLHSLVMDSIYDIISIQFECAEWNELWLLKLNRKLTDENTICILCHRFSECPSLLRKSFRLSYYIHCVDYRI